MKPRRVLEWLGYVMGLASTFTLLLAMSWSYFINGETTVLLDFNIIGETVPEIVLLFFGFIGLILLFFTLIKKEV